MGQKGVQKGVSLLDLHHPQVASNGFHRVSYGDPLFSPFGHFRRTRYGTSHTQAYGSICSRGHHGVAKWIMHMETPAPLAHVPGDLMMAKRSICSK